MQIQTRNIDINRIFSCIHNVHAYWSTQWCLIHICPHLLYIYHVSFFKPTFPPPRVQAISVHRFCLGEVETPSNTHRKGLPDLLLGWQREVEGNGGNDPTLASSKVERFPQHLHLEPEISSNKNSSHFVFHKSITLVPNDVPMHLFYHKYQILWGSCTFKKTIASSQWPICVVHI